VERGKVQNRSSYKDGTTAQPGRREIGDLADSARAANARPRAIDGWMWASLRDRSISLYRHSARGGQLGFPGAPISRSAPLDTTMGSARRQPLLVPPGGGGGGASTRAAAISTCPGLPPPPTRAPGEPDETIRRTDGRTRGELRLDRSSPSGDIVR
jgi:hypothetical protein